MSKLLGKILIRIPFLRYAYLSKYNTSFRPGHYYSPVADVDDLRARQNEIWAPKELAGIEMNEDEQKDFFSYLLKNERSFNIPAIKEPSKRYFAESASFPYVDGIVLYSMMAKYKPRNVFEVGSGSSSGCMIDASEHYGLHTNFTLIEPFPQYCLDKVVSPAEYERVRVNLVKDRVQILAPSAFKVLQENDILFIDSSHVSKPGSEVNYLLTQVLPILNKGVIIHFHDIYYPLNIQKSTCWN